MKIKVCTGVSCRDKFSEYIIKRIKNDIEFYNLENIEIEESTCMGMCDKGPNVKIDKEIFNNTNPLKISDIMLKKIGIRKSKKKK